MLRLGFIGAGNMGGAILKGILHNRVITADNVYVYDANPALLAKLTQELGVKSAGNNAEVCEASDIIILAVKPNMCPNVLAQCKSALHNKAVISIVTGFTRAMFEAVVPDARMLRVMPNTPCLVGEGMSVFDADHTLTAAEYEFAAQIFGSIGKVETVQPQLMGAVTGVSGSGPAYVYMFIEALADGGVRAGLPRKAAYALATQTVLGAAKMVQATGLHPGELKDNICTPGGTTIEAVAVLEQSGLRAAVIDAVTACAKKADEMSERA